MDLLSSFGLFFRGHRIDVDHQLVVFDTAIVDVVTARNSSDAKRHAAPKVSQGDVDQRFPSVSFPLLLAWGVSLEF
jgi:hypothetical protein